MTGARPTDDAPGLSAPAQTYVAVVALCAALTQLVESQAAWAALVVLALPLSLVATWVAFYAGLAVGLLTGTAHQEPSWPVLVVWVAVWTATAWVNARLLEKLLRRGWDALRT
ncbi:hypothetical protein [Nocardioides marmoraquaticus]